MSSGFEAPPVTASTQQHMHTAKSLWWFEPWSRAPSVTCAQIDECAGRHAVDDSHGSSHLGNLPGVPLARGVIVAHASDPVVEPEAAGHRNRPNTTRITPRGRWQGCRYGIAPAQRNEKKPRIPGCPEWPQPHSLTLVSYMPLARDS